MIQHDVKRTWAAWALLSVFLPMTVCLSLHVHPTAYDEAGSCYECAHHMHHSGHLTTAQDCLHDCLLCQLCQVPFLYASTTLLAPCALLRGLRCPMGHADAVVRAVGILPSRGPPCV